MLNIYLDASININRNSEILASFDLCDNNTKVNNNILRFKIINFNKYICLQIIDDICFHNKEFDSQLAIYAIKNKYLNLYILININNLIFYITH